MAESVVNDDAVDSDILTISVTKPIPSSGSSSASSTSSTDQPDRRRHNPLSAFSSYTYQLSFYMLTPAAYDAFVAAGRLSLRSLTNSEGELIGGAYLVAQSGGINKNVDVRASENELDYYIDNLSIKTFLSGQGSTTASVSTEVKFQIIEPYGFSFLTDLRRFADIIYKDSPNVARPPDPTRLFYVIGVKFLGYDKDGNVVNTSNTDLSGVDDDLSRIQDRYYDIKITGIKFKLAGQATTYDITAVALPPNIALGIMKGTLKTSFSTDKTIVRDIIDDLKEKLNSDQEEVEKRLGHRLNRYDFRWEGPGIEEIADASIVTPTKNKNFQGDKDDSAGSIAMNTAESTDAIGNTDPRTEEKLFQAKGSTSIMQVVSQIITQSTYVSEKLEQTFASEAQPLPETGDYEKEFPGDGIINSWYTLSAEVKNAVWVKDIADFVYDITFVIQPHETPALVSTYAVAKDNYYGPYKRYDYWYTGKNTEIISFEQNVNNAYFTIFLDVASKHMKNGDATFGESVSANPTQQQAQPRDNSKAEGAEAANGVATSLYDPGSFVTANITILGDPDLLMTDSPVIPYNKFYAPDGFTVNPLGAQTFIEINFYEARDIDTEMGYLKINRKILFWNYPSGTEDDANIEGISYMVRSLVSTFQGGAFRQKLDCILNPIHLRSPKNTGTEERTALLPVTAPPNRIILPGNPGFVPGLLPEQTREFVALDEPFSIFRSQTQDPDDA
jgi:hypothetical protein